MRVRTRRVHVRASVAVAVLLLKFGAAVANQLLLHSHEFIDKNKTTTTTPASNQVIKMNPATPIRLLTRLLLAITILTIATSSASKIQQQAQISSSSSSKTPRHNIEEAQSQSKESAAAAKAGASHFAPKLIHQPQSAIVQPSKPHTVECAIESEPEAEIKWFKDDQLLGAQPTHLEQQGNELMFFQMNEEDTGEYRCQATNYLGSISSEPFRLTVHSSVHDATIRFEPKLAETGLDQSIELTCTIPADHRQEQHPGSLAEVGWRRNGRKLLVEWLENSEDLSSVRNRFVARKLNAGQFSLTVLRAQMRDDNSSFTCLHKLVQSEENEADLLASESSPVLLRVREHYPMNNINLGPPIEELANAKPQPTDKLANNSNTIHTTRLQDSTSPKSIQETVRALFELAKPVLSIVGVFALVGLLVGLQLIYMRRRSSCCQSSTNRYMKHHHHQSVSYGSSSASSSAGGCSGTGGSASSAESGGILGPHLLHGTDPVLSSLLGRTLSAPSCAKAAATTLAGSKKYRSYRDHMRKVAAVQEGPVMSHTDIVDSYLAQLSAGGVQQNPFQQQQQLQLPNLYNQSLAAREQARSLLQASEHMRSLSNLNQQQHHHAGKHLQQHQQQRVGLNGSHLNLPLSFAFSRTTNNNLDNQQQQQQPGGGALWPPLTHLKQHISAVAVRAPQIHPPQFDEHYQLVDCSNSSVSPSTSSSAAGSNSAGQLRRSSSELNNNNNIRSASEQQSNHYSTIENDEDANQSQEEYEELDQHQRQMSSKRGSSFLVPGQDANPPKRANKNTAARQTHYPDQPSPYAVSSICNSLPASQQQQQQPAAAPPVNSEAMRALTEQFDINQLMLMDDNKSSAFADQQLPPPPPASSKPQVDDKQTTHNKRRT